MCFIRRTKKSANKNHPPSKNKKFGTSGQATSSFNRNRFTSLEREERYTTLLQWAFIPERRVELQHNEYPEFLESLDWLKWGEIASPHDKFDPEVVREFYANAYPPDEGGEIFEHKSWVRAQIWMIFLLHNIIPNSHVSSLPMPDCYLIYSILAMVEIDVAQVMATEIYKTAVKGGKKGTMGFPSLITSLCARQGVQVNPTEPIKKAITKQYIK
ncbi:hypothetical protein Lal_00002626 [Lupinus albus]|nr:hypothetical protein Lal_00002626 [Lupinus albus]